jgi:hypothetical protein
MCTLTLSNLDSIYISRFPIVLYNSCAVTIPKYLGPSQLENYVRIVVFEPDLRRASFYSRIELVPPSREQARLRYIVYYRICLND